MSLPKYIVNIEELASLLEDGIILQPTVTLGNLEELLKEYLEKISGLINQSSGVAEVGQNYSQRSVGLHSYIPALDFDYELIHVFEEDVYVTGITYSQTGWKVMDCWSLYIGEELLFDGVFTKELGEYKHFNVFYGVQAGTEIKIIHHNNSGNSKQVWYDIEYLKWLPAPYVPAEPELKPEPEPAPEPTEQNPDAPPDFPQGRMWVIYIEWENGGDIDCCWADASNDQILLGYIGGKLGIAPNIIYKDRDCTGLDYAGGKLPYYETWSLEGKFRDKLMWGIGWFITTEHRYAENINVTLYDGNGYVVDIISNISGDELEFISNMRGDFLFLYEFDLTQPNPENQWKRINRKVNN